MGKNEPFINYELLARVEKARLEMPEYEKPVASENRTLSRFMDQCRTLSEAEFAAVVLIALRTCPHVVLKVILDELEGKNNE